LRQSRIFYSLKKQEGFVLKFVLSLVVASVVAMPVAFAQPKHDNHNRSSGHHHSQSQRMAPKHMRPSHRHQNRRYRPGHHYRSAPHGWHRYHRRPRDWQTRGCIVVGPVWFCP
jgi:Ni/Co efflux regulator RcnB